MFLPSFCVSSHTNYQSALYTPVLLSLCRFTHQLPVCPISLADTPILLSLCLFTHQLPVCPISLAGTPVLRYFIASWTSSAVSNDRCAYNIQWRSHVYINTCYSGLNSRWKNSAIKKSTCGRRLITLCLVKRCFSVSLQYDKLWFLIRPFVGLNGNFLWPKTKELLCNLLCRHVTWQGHRHVTCKMSFLVNFLPLYLTFRGPCIVLYSYNETN